MRQVLLIIFILIASQSFGQKWHLNNIDTTNQYPYEYWFQFKNLDDTCTYRLTKKSGQKKSIIELYNNQGDIVIFANIKIQDIETDSVTNLFSDFSGQANIHLEKGKYRIEVSAMNYDKFHLEFEVNNKQYMELKIHLGLAPELTVYQIDSKSELTENEILEIMKCVKKNRNEYYKDCFDNKKYRIMMHI